LPELFVDSLLWLVVFFTVYSGLHYLWRTRQLVSSAPEA
jgi:hypothetical protein